MFKSAACNVLLVFGLLGLGACDTTAPSNQALAAVRVSQDEALSELINKYTTREDAFIALANIGVGDGPICQTQAQALAQLLATAKSGETPVSRSPEAAVALYACVVQAVTPAR